MIDRATTGNFELTGPSAAKPQPPGKRSPFLIVFAGGVPGDLRSLRPPRETLGRGESCTVRFDHEALAPLHAIFDIDSQGRVRIIDHRSPNGVMVNGVRLLPLQPKRLRAGDRIHFGDLVLKYAELDEVEEQSHREQFRLTICDQLTGLFNRQHFLEQAPLLAERCVSQKRGIAILLIDVDRFKAVNDQLGHLIGDAALRMVAGVLSRVMRPDDLVARYGGEEFIVAIPANDSTEAVAFAESIRKTFVAEPLQTRQGPWSLTISVGVAFSRWEQSWNAEGLIKKADDRLNLAKRTGRNRVIGL